MLSRLFVATLVAALVATAAVTAVAFGAHATGTYSGRTSERLRISLKVTGDAITSAAVTVRVTCTRSGSSRRTHLSDTAHPGRIALAADGSFSAHQVSRRSGLVLDVAGRVVGRRATGTYSERFPDRGLRCASGKVRFTATR